MRGKINYKEYKIEPDIKFGSLEIAKFINYVMRRGKKTVAETMVYKALNEAARLVKNNNPILVFETAIKNVEPKLEVRSRRVGGATYMVPTEVRPERKISLSYRWLIQGARDKKGKPMWQKLGEEIAAAFGKTGSAVKRKEDMHKAAEANKAFAHFARF